jgi:YggT family protein
VILALSDVRGTIADFVLALTWVYTLLIFAYILTNLAFTAGLRIPYSRTSDAVIGFLRDVCEPYLRLFRRILPSIGGLDFSPIIAIILLQVVGNLIANDAIK